MIYSALITGFVWMILASALAVSIGAMIGAVVNSKEGGDALANPAAQDRRSHPSDQARAGLGAPRFDQLS